MQKPKKQKTSNRQQLYLWDASFILQEIYVKPLTAFGTFNGMLTPFIRQFDDRLTMLTFSETGCLDEFDSVNKKLSFGSDGHLS